MRLLVLIIICINSAFSSGKINKIEADSYTVDFVLENSPQIPRFSSGKDYELTKDSLYFTLESGKVEVLSLKNVKKLKYENGNMGVQSALVIGGVTFFGTGIYNYNYTGEFKPGVVETGLALALGGFVGYLIKSYDPIDLNAPTKDISFNFYPDINLLTGSYQLSLQIKF